LSFSCSICIHENRREIDHHAISGVPVSQVANQHGVSYHALRRHIQSHLPKALVKAEMEAREAQEQDHAASLWDTAQRLTMEALGVLDRARAKEDERLALLAVREARGCLELQAKLAGELVEPQPAYAIGVLPRLSDADRGALLDVARRLALGSGGDVGPVVDTEASRPAAE
jgi:hypothetical protein